MPAITSTYLDTSMDLFCVEFKPFKAGRIFARGRRCSAIFSTALSGRWEEAGRFREDVTVMG